MLTLGHYSQIFAVPKPGGKWRVVINMKPLNEHVLKETFRMETSRDVRSLLKPGDFGAVIDLTDAYYTVKLHQDSRKYCRFIIDGVIYEYVALPMGLTCSARIFYVLPSSLEPSSECRVSGSSCISMIY